jgi:hypothetical protein
MELGKTEEQEWIDKAVREGKHNSRPILRCVRGPDGKVIMKDYNDINNRGRYNNFRSRVSGEWFTQDAYKVRYERMRSRVVAWANVLKEIVEDVFYRHITLTYDTFGTVIEAHKWRPNDIRDFELKLRSYIAKKWPGIIIWGMAWVGEIQPTSKQYHYELMLATSGRIYFPDGVIDKLWGRGFVKVKEPSSPWYLVAYCKKKNQKDYWYFPYRARGFGIWVSPCAESGKYKSKTLLKFHSLKIWQMNYLMQHSTGDDLVMDMVEKLGGVRAPPSEWEWMGSFVKLENAERQVSEEKSNG